MPGAFGGHDADFKDAVVGGGVLENGYARKQRPHVADEDTAGIALKPNVAVGLDHGANSLGSDVPRTRQNVRRSSHSIFQRLARSRDHPCIKTKAGHDGKVFAVDPTYVDRAAITMQADADRPVDVLRDSQIGGQKVRGSGRDDCEGCVAADKRVDAPLHSAVATPDEHNVRARSAKVPRDGRDLLALVNFVPTQLGDAIATETFTEGREATAECFTGVRNDGNRVHETQVPARRRNETSFVGDVSVSQRSGTDGTCRSLASAR